MSAESLVISLFVHIMSTVIWIGGLFVTLILVYPAVRRHLDKTPTLYKLLSTMRKRFYAISNLCLLALIATGLFQMTADEYYDGFMTFDNTWSKVMLAKHGLIVAMALSGLLLQYGVAPVLERTSLLLAYEKGDDSTNEQWKSLRQREMWLSWLIALLGVAVLGCSAWVTAL